MLINFINPQCNYSIQTESTTTGTTKEQDDEHGDLNIKTHTTWTLQQ